MKITIDYGLFLFAWQQCDKQHDIVLILCVPVDNGTADVIVMDMSLVLITSNNEALTDITPVLVCAARLQETCLLYFERIPMTSLIVSD